MSKSRILAFYRPIVFFSYFVLHLVLNCTLSFRASSKVLRSFQLVGAGLLFWVPHFTTSIWWALRVGLQRFETLLCQVDPLRAVSESVHPPSPPASANEVRLFAAS